jgi:ligand-binding sensor domain-containing protein
MYRIEMEPAATLTGLIARTVWRVSIVAVFGFSPLLAHAETAVAPANPRFMIKGWTMADGLPHLSVTALAQTADGCLWVGTLAGLARFDGIRFKVFTPQNCPELPRSRIGGLFAMSDGTLFVATANLSNCSGPATNTTKFSPAFRNRAATPFLSPDPGLCGSGRTAG